VKLTALVPLVPSVATHELYGFRARMVDSKTGRFKTKDPLWNNPKLEFLPYSPGNVLLALATPSINVSRRSDLDGASSNSRLYEFMKSSPTLFGDPLGLCNQLCALGFTCCTSAAGTVCSNAGTPGAYTACMAARGSCYNFYNCWSCTGTCWCGLFICAGNLPPWPPVPVPPGPGRYPVRGTKTATGTCNSTLPKNHCTCP